MINPAPIKGNQVSHVRIERKIKGNVNGEEHRFGDAAFNVEVIEIATQDRSGYLVSIIAGADCGGSDMMNWLETYNRDEIKFIAGLDADSLIEALQFAKYARTKFEADVICCAHECVKEATALRVELVGETYHVFSGDKDLADTGRADHQRAMVWLDMHKETLRDIADGIKASPFTSTGDKQ